MTSAGETMISRVVRILETFQSGDDSLTVPQISERSQLPIATTHRLVRELARWGILERGEDHRVRTGLRLWELSVRSSPQLRLRDRVLPVMKTLQAAVKQHTHLMVLDGTDIVYIERLSAKDGAVNITRVGGRLPAANTAPGMVFAAYSSQETADAILETIPAPLTEFSPTSREELSKVIAETRRTGVAVAEGWIHSNATGIAAPIRDIGKNQVIATLSLIVPRDKKLVRAVIPALQAAARAAEHALSSDEEKPRDPQLNLLEALIRQSTTDGSGRVAEDTDE
jgi:DNA-binding IclR family transcriptional regulator